jgi:hypothetical protein
MVGFFVRVVLLSSRRTLEDIEVRKKGGFWPPKEEREFGLEEGELIRPPRTKRKKS